MSPPLTPSAAAKLIHHVKDVFTFVDVSGVVQYQSRSSIEYFGYTPEEVVGKPMLDFIHPDDHQEAIASISRTLEEEQVNPRLIVRLLHKEGYPTRIEVVARLVKSNELQGILLQIRDVSERQSTLENVMRSERMFEAMFQSTSVIHTITDPDTGEYLRVNEAFFRIMGWTQAETIGHTAVELNIWRDVSNREAIMRALTVGDGSVRDYQVDFQTKDGQSRTMLVDMEAVELPEGKRLFLSAVDITDREIIEKQLRRSQKMEAVGQLTGGIAHDFNNLLGVIIGHAELLSQNLSHKDQIQSSADAILRAADNGSELIKNLLGFSRQASTHAAPTDIPNRIDDLISLLSTTLGKDIKLEVLNRAAQSISNLDPAQLDSAILNLAINSRYAMPNGGTLTITISNELIKPNEHIDLRPGNYINLAIEDNGIGMSEAVSSRAFEPFFTSREFGGGSGLGLSMVFGFAKQSNGTASIKSKPGEGTTVQLLLPVTNDAESVALSEEQIPKQDFNAQRVLLVEDNPDISDLVTLLLQSLGFEVTTEESGDLALSHIDVHFDLIVSDVMLPGTKKGPDVVRAFREKYQQLPALYMSGYQPGILSASELEHPSVEYIQKPFTRQQFNKKISLIKA